MRTCIKCGRELSLGMFEDTWMYKTNECKDCKRQRTKDYRRTYFDSLVGTRRRLINKVKRLEQQLEQAKIDLVQTEKALKKERSE